ncbi:MULTISPECIES: YfiR family protein [unclassified Roseateles]|uniref:YfiR family protein n=1 Tax=unclassified Roseateles TaxID=2626991 RepID=UPI0022B8E7C2|nr:MULTISPECIES: YfiR family protein [unclassified Roseateles]MCZ7884019.1 YfiR family protein [Paucibacter sp. M5-1]MDC6170723.1 YfiR family protein [Paucibacter sp. XJ19-41]
MSKLWLPLAWLLLAAPAAANEPVPEDARLKAAFIYRFAQFTGWPPPPLRSFTLCLAGTSPELAAALREQVRRPWGGLLPELALPERPEQARHCQLLVLGELGRAELRRWMLALEASPVLLVADSPEAFRAGADIGLIQEPNSLAFRVNLSESRRRGLVLSAQMLKLAREVR